MSLERKNDWARQLIISVEILLANLNSFLKLVKGFRLLRRIKIYHMNSSKIVTKLAYVLKHFHQWLWLSAKKNRLLVIKNQRQNDNFACSNASDRQKLKFPCAGGSWKNLAFENITPTALQFLCKSQKSGWIQSETFEKGFILNSILR
jgi:hypothetical protein